MTDHKYWNNAKEFRPERFLENGKYLKTRPKAFIPFGVGRRICLGEKLATADLFLVLVRLLQKTANYQIVNGNNHANNAHQTEPPIHISDIHSPRDYKIRFKTK